MNKKLIGVGTVLALILTAISVNFVYASMYGRAVARSLEPSMEEHTEMISAARASEASMELDNMRLSLEPSPVEHRTEMNSAVAYGAVVAEQLRVLEREKKVASIVSSGTKGEYQKYAWSKFESYGWNEDDLSALINLWNRESGWNPNAHNSSSGAHGIPQALPASKMASYGSDYMTGYKPQIDWGLNYISSRYGSPSRAWSFFCSHNWY